MSTLPLSAYAVEIQKSSYLQAAQPVETIFFCFFLMMPFFNLKMDEQGIFRRIGVPDALQGCS
jgi:hypothetical protein